MFGCLTVLTACQLRLVSYPAAFAVERSGSTFAVVPRRCRLRFQATPSIPAYIPPNSLVRYLVSLAGSKMGIVAPCTSIFQVHSITLSD